MNLQFEWDRGKAAANFRKHGIIFAEAMTVFNDPLAYTIEDELNSEMETREVIIGHSANHRLLLVAFTERNEELVRIFSARQATRKERRDYEKGSKY